MPGNATDLQRLRRQRMLGLIADGECTADELLARLRPKVSRRTLDADLAWMQARFPEQLRKRRGGDARTVWWSLVGLPPILLDTTLDALTHDEVAAITAARGLLRSPDNRTPGWERPSSAYAGDLSAALHGLLLRLGLGAEAKAIAPSSLGASRFGIAPEPPGCLASLQRALRTGQAARFTYRNRQGSERPCHVWPIRLVLIKGEWFCFAWAPGQSGGRVKQYALARITSREPVVAIDPRLPPGAPPRPPHAAVDAALASGFHATGSDDPRHRVRVSLAVGPDAWPSIADRTWGENQTVTTEPPDLPPGWHRLVFTTSGLAECRHWVLSFGAAVRAESPAELTTWLRQQAESIVTHMPAGHAAGDDDNLPPTIQGSP
jgi:predicted DNA-binding transcriptional regulator YafY